MTELYFIKIFLKLQKIFPESGNNSDVYNS